MMTDEVHNKAGKPKARRPGAIRATLIMFALALSVAAQHPQQTITGKVIGVADGDTITVLDDQKRQHKIRLDGVDVDATPVWALVFQAFVVLVSIVFIVPSGYLIYGLISFLIWIFAVAYVFEMMTIGKNWAGIVLAIIAFPIGLTFLLSPRLKSYIRRRSINI